MDVFVVEGVRTPFCKAGSALAEHSAQELGRIALSELIARAEIEPRAIDCVVTGNVANPFEAANVSRVIALMAGLPEAVPAHTLSRNCASGMEAVVDAARRIATGECGVVAALGVESMSRIPLVFSDGFRRVATRVARARGAVARLRAWSALRPRDLRPVPALIAGLTDPVSGLNMGETAEELAREFVIGREAQDRFARGSHARAVAARKAGRLAEEIVPVFLAPRRSGVVAEDVGPREESQLTRLEQLPPVFVKGGTVSAGNSSMVTDGAVALLLASGERMHELGLSALARLVSHAEVGLDPRRMGLGPALAMPRALDHAGLRLGDLDLVEINEAFAAQVLACLSALASSHFAREELGRGEPVGELDPSRLNVNGGAIALGHPVGASGARLVLTLARELVRRRARYGLASLCVGGGQGQALILEAAA